jgi:hypothetical protein
MRKERRIMRRCKDLLDTSLFQSNTFTQKASD